MDWMARAAEIEAAFNGSTVSTLSTVPTNRRPQRRSVGSVESVDLLNSACAARSASQIPRFNLREALPARILRTCAAAEGRALSIVTIARHLGAPVGPVRSAAAELARLGYLEIGDDALIAPRKRPARLRLV